MPPEIHRIEARKYDNKVWESKTNGGWWPFTSSEESEYNPDAPWDHIYHQAVVSEFANRWWNENFIWPAQQIVSKAKPQGAFLGDDAPIANGFTRPMGDSSPGLGKPTKRPTGDGTKGGGKGQLQLQDQQTRPEKRKFSDDTSGKKEICNMHNQGSCGNVVSDGAAGAFSCAKRPHTIHACDICVRPNHPSSACHRAKDAEDKKKQQSKKDRKNRRGD